MSKVYSFRLSDDNPREVQAREVIEAWVEDGFSLRHVVVEGLQRLSKSKPDVSNISSVVDILENILQKIEMDERKLLDYKSKSNLHPSFVSAVKKTAKIGMRSRK